MLAIDDIHDRESFQAWLRETRQPREVCLGLAARSALRVLPISWKWAMFQDESPISFLRTNLFVHILGMAPTQLLGETEQTRSLQIRAAIDAAFATADAALVPFTSGKSREGQAANAAFAAARVAARLGAASADHAITLAADSAHASAWAAAYNDADALGTIWAAIRSDCADLSDFSKPLFASASFVPFEFDLAAVSVASSSDWRFWLKWFETVFEGRPPNWPLLLEIANQENAFWQGTDAEVNARIAEIVEEGAWIEVPAARFDVTAHAPTVEAGRRYSDPEALALAIQRTENGEEIFVNDDDVLDSRPVTDLTEQDFAEIVRRLKNIVGLMQKFSTRTDIYNVLTIRLDDMRLTLNRRSTTPTDVHDLCRRTRRFVQRSRQLDDLPRNDPNLDDFTTALEEAEHELSQRDGSVRERIRLLTNPRFERLTDEQKTEFKASTEALATISTSELAEAQRQDITTASDDAADPQDQNEARYRWTSRFVRMYKQAKHFTTRLGLTPERINAITAVAERVIRWILNSGNGS